MVISHGCDMDKPASITCYVVQVVPLSTLPPSGHGAVRQGKVAAVMHLPTLESLGGESFADLRKIFRVPLTQLCDAELRTEQNGDRVRVLSHPHNRVAALSDEGLEVLHGQLMFFFTRRKF